MSRGFAFAAIANPRQILASDGFRCIQPSNRLPDLRLGSAGGLEVQRILIFPCFTFPQTFVVQICLKIGCTKACMEITLFVSGFKKCGLWRWSSGAILEVFLYPIPWWATCKGSGWDYEDLEQLWE